MLPNHHKSYQICLIVPNTLFFFFESGRFCFLFLMKVYSCCSTATLWAHSRKGSLEPSTRHLLYAGQGVGLAKSTEHGLWEGSVLLCLPPPLSSASSVWNACQGALSGFRDVPYHPVVLSMQ